MQVGTVPGIRTSVEILLVGKDEQQRVLHFAILDDAGELSSSLVDAIAVVGVNDEDEALGACGMLAGFGGIGAVTGQDEEASQCACSVLARLPRSEPPVRNIPEK